MPLGGRCACPASVRWPSSLTSLSDLAANDLTRVADALALVRLGLAQLADVCGHLADELLVDPRDPEAGRVLDGEGDALRRVEHDGVGVPELELQLVESPGQDEERRVGKEC